MKFTVSKGKVNAPVRCVIYGAEGVGKSTLAAQFPTPFFIDVEGGTNQLDVMRFAEKPAKWGELLEMVDAIASMDEKPGTLVLDTVDRAEHLLLTSLCADGRVKSIEEYGGGYGKGYTAMYERFMNDLIPRLDVCVSKGINVVLLCHAIMRKFENPDQASYDRWELKLSKKIAPVVKEWADMMLFCEFKTTVVVTDERNNKGRAKGSTKRVMHGNHKAVYDAKNRYGLPDEMPMDISALSAVFAGQVQRQPERTTLDIKRPNDGIVEEPLEECIDVLERELIARGYSLERLYKYLEGTGRPTPPLSETYTKTLLNAVDRLADAIAKYENKGE